MPFQPSSQRARTSRRLTALTLSRPDAARRNEAPRVSYNHVSDEVMHRMLAADFADGAHLTFADGEFRRFTGTHWATLGEAELGRIVIAHLPDQVAKGRQRTPSLIRDVIATLRSAAAIEARPVRRSEPKPIINVAQGKLWIEADGSVTLRLHDPASGQLHCLDVVYDPTATCPSYDRALEEIFSASTDPAALISLWDELVGYLLQPARPRPLIIIAAGQGRDGKSALAEVLVGLLGREQVAAMPVEDLTGSRFTLGELVEKRLLLDAGHGG